jgi:hypothetical protein
MNRAWIRVSVAILVLGTFCAKRLLACSCGTLPRTFDCRDLKPIGPSFVGTVISIENPADERRGSIDQVGLSRYRFRVDENIDGFPVKEVDIYSGRGGGDCSYHFQKGESYFVTPYQRTQTETVVPYRRGAPTGKLMAGICTETQPAASAGALLEELRARKKGSSVVGVLRTKHEPDEDNHRMPDIPVELWGERTTFSAQTDKDGFFRFLGIPTGTYRFAVEVPRNFQLAAEPPGDSPPSITITEQRCYAKDVYSVPMARTDAR